MDIFFLEYIFINIFEIEYQHSIFFPTKFIKRPCTITIFTLCHTKTHAHTWSKLKTQKSELHV